MFGFERKSVIWLGSSRKDIRAFPDTARARAGYELCRLERGLKPTDWKPMTSVGDGVNEIRVHAGSEFRLLYVTKFGEAIYVLHVFAKNTQKTRRIDLKTAGSRYAKLILERARLRE